MEMTCWPWSITTTMSLNAAIANCTGLPYVGRDCLYQVVSIKIFQG